MAEKSYRSYNSSQNYLNYQIYQNYKNYLNYQIYKNYRIMALRPG